MEYTRTKFMPTGTNTQLYTILAVIFGVLGIGIFLYPGAPFTPVGWLIRALVLIAFGVFLWLLLQDLRELNSTLHSYEQHSREEQPSPTQIEIDFPEKSPQPSSENTLDATEAYHTFQGYLLEIIRETFVCNSAMIYIADQEREALVLQDSKTPGQNELVQKVRVANSMLGKTFRENSSVLLNQSTDESAFNALSYYSGVTPDINSFLAVPLRYSSAAIGVLAIDDTTQEAYSPDDATLLERFAELVANAMVQLDVIDQLNTQRDFYAEMVKINSTLSISDDPNSLFEHLVQIAKQAFNYDRMYVILLQAQESNQAEIAKVDGKNIQIQKGFRFEITGGLLHQVLKSGEPRILSTSPTDGNAPILPWETGEERELHRSALIVPVTNHSEIFGFILMEKHQSGPFTSRDQEILTLLGSIVGGGLNRFYLYRYMKNIATRDGLTDVGNHRAFQERLDEEIKRSERYQSALTLLVIDLDKFKQVNDSFGHLYGDYILKTVAQLINNNVRVVDFVARYGGDEFTIILVNARKTDTVKTAERIRKSILEYQFEKDGIKERISASIGMAEYPSDATSGEELLKKADKAMYRVKQLGGNAVKVYQDASEKEEV